MGKGVDIEIDFDGLAEILVLGYPLQGRTMLKHVKVPVAPIPNFEIQSKPTTIDDVYEALKESVQNSIKSDMIMGLSGGLDSRIIAGLISQFDKNVIAITWGESSIEKKIASKICSVLGLRHFTIDDEYLLNDELMEQIKEKNLGMGGILTVCTVLQEIIVGKYLEYLGIKYIVTGGAFDEINGGSTGSQLTSKERFCRTLVESCHPILSEKYRETTLKNLREYCENIDFNELFISVIVRNRFLRMIESRFAPFYARAHLPVLDPCVISTILSVPYRERMNKNIQRKILRKYFPELYKIPNPMTMFPLSFPHILHRGINKVIREMYGYKKCPFMTISRAHFYRTNIHFFRGILLRYPPPFLNSEDIKHLINNLRYENADLISRITAYSLIKEHLENN